MESVNAQEQGEGGPRAIFQYAVPQDKSHYQVAHCCLADGDGTSVLRTPVGYHGKIAIDPASGAILRITVEADLQPKQPPRLALIRSDIMVEYGAVEIGRHTHLPLEERLHFTRADRKGHQRMGRWSHNLRSL